ncbi:MAG: hypothetical protein VKP63_03565 [Cyanobacteriota bacterium]|nr:hypothetical protein [Cyanobacteriota bacterium]
MVSNRTTGTELPPGVLTAAWWDRRLLFLEAAALFREGWRV